MGSECHHPWCFWSKPADCRNSRGSVHSNAAKLLHISSCLGRTEIKTTGSQDKESIRNCQEEIIVQNVCLFVCVFLTLIKSNNFPQEISVSALQKNLILTITGEIKKWSFPCAFYIKVFSCGCLRRTMSKLAFLCSCLSDNPSIFLCGFRLAPINISKQDLSLDWHVL